MFLTAGGLIVGLWAARNYRALGRPVLATTHGGYTLLLGNNEGFYRYLANRGWGDVWDSRELDAEYNEYRRACGYDEVQADRWAYRRAIQCVRNDVGSFLRSCLVRAGRLWGVLPHQVDPAESLLRRLVRYAVAVWYTGVFLLAGLGAIRLGRRLCRGPYVWGLLLCLSFTLVHTFYWSNLRMRAPLMPVVCLLAALGARYCVAETK
jgi:hypothetical protein